MKRIGNLFEKITSMDNLRLAYAHAKRGKSWYKEVREMEKDVDGYLRKIQTALVLKTFTTSEYDVFVKKDSGKERVIYRLPFYPDRVVQWALLQVLEPYLLRHFIDQTYSAIPGRGMHKCLEDVKRAIRTDKEGCQYCLKIDVKKYYPHIDHTILKQKYRRLLKDPDALWLIDDIIDSTEGETGIPIGNYVSQYSGNFYLSSFDHWLKEEKHVKHYFRYMDDCVILSDSKAFLHELLKDIKAYLADNLKLSVKDNYQVFPTYVRGIDFVGYRIFEDFVLVRKNIAKAMKVKVRSTQKKLREGKEMSFSDACAIQSYAGWIDKANAYRLNQIYIRPMQPTITNYLKGRHTENGKNCESTSN